MFNAVSSKPDLVAQEHEMLAQWQERRTFARLRAQNADGPRWSFLDGPITANNPMGVHHAWGRTYKDLYQRFHAMLGEHQRYQNGFDCQGLWVEVNVERDLGFTSKRDIEAYGIDRFVTLCKQRVLTYAARQTEQSIRLGMWMDWNDPDELRRLHDLLDDEPTRVTTIEGPNGPVTDTVEMLVGRLGMPDTGGSYFTFSNENNDLIWGFLAECHRRGWLYKGHDTMPWCGRCGTGLSQMELNEGYQDREDPGLTVRFPLTDRPGEALLVWTTTPWTLTSNVAAAVGADLRYVRVRQGEDRFWLAKGTLKTALQGPFEVEDEVAGTDLVGWEYAGPFDDLPAVRAAFAAGTRDDPATPYRHRVVAWDEVGEDEGTGIVHIAPGCGAEDFQLGKSLGLPVIAPIDESGIVVEGFGSLSGRDARDVAEPIVAHLKREGRFYRLEPYLHRYPHCWRCGTPLLFRLVDEWYISMGPVYDQPRETLTAEQVDASLRYQIMDVVDTIEWIPGFGLERELDWLRNMHDWMISKKRYWGLALPIYDCSACGTIEVIGGREELRERAVSGWEGFEGHTPHRPWIDGVTIACPSCGGPVERIRDVGNPWLDAGIVPFSTLHFREDPDYWAQWFPADFITESFPGQFRNWFYSMLAMSTVLRRERPFKTIFGYAPGLRRGRPADAQVVGQRDRLRRGRGADGRRRHALDVREGAARGEHPLRLARRRRGPPRAAGALERLRVLRDVRAPGGLDAGRGRGAAGPRARRARPLDPVACRRHRGGGRGAPARVRRGRGDPRAVGVHGRPLHLVRAPVARADAPQRRRDRPCRGVRDAPRGAARHGRDARADPAVPVRFDVREPRGRRGRPPGFGASHAAGRRPAWPATATPASSGRWRSRRTRSTSPARCAARPGSGPASRWPTRGWRCPTAASTSVRSCSRSSPTRSTSSRSRSSPTTPTSSSGASSRCSPRSASGWAPRSRP